MEAGYETSVAVNVSPRQFKQDDFTDTVIDALKNAGLPPKRLELEITESMAVSDPEQVTEIMRPLRAMGVRLAIDDFGTGHSNLSMLTKLPFDVFKIDRQFVSTLQSDRQAPAIVEMILAMAETLGLETVAEGVETPLQADFLRRRGCTLAQGFYYSPGVPQADFMTLLRKWDRGFVGPDQRIAV
jgi:EAL domain-containing protein (putative c-di-GMP-specific phosphodiesterase class I)